jgi:hypothetical protein
MYFVLQRRIQPSHYQELACLVNGDQESRAETFTPADNDATMRRSLSVAVFCLHS